MMRSLSAAVSSSSSPVRARWLAPLGRLAAVLTLAAPLAACMDDDDRDPPPPPPPPSTPTITCTASVSPFSFLYEVGDGGRMLVVAPRTINEDTLERIGVPAPGITGTWLLEDKPTALGNLRAELTFGPADLTVTTICTTLANKTGRVSVTVAATITPTQVSVLGSATKSIQVK